MSVTRAGHAGADEPTTTELLTLTAAKTVQNATLRWIPAFLPAIGRGVGVGVGSMATLLSIGELAGLAAIAVGRMAGRTRERRLLAAALLVAAAGSALAGVFAHPLGFLAGYALLQLGGVVFVTTGHVWLGRSYRVERRGRALGIFETSWAIGLLVGAPLAGLAVAWLGWRAPFLGFAVLNVVAAVTVLRLHDTMPAPPKPASSNPAGDRAARPTMPATAKATVATIIAIWFASIATVVVYGAWFEDAFGFSSATIGLASILLGLTELTASGSVTVLTDRFGAARSVRFGLVGMLGSLGAIAFAGNEAWIGVAGLVVFLGTYEFGFVSAMAMVTEADRHLPGRVVGLTHSAGTLTRAAAALTGGVLYERVGMGAVTVVSVAGTLVAWAALRRTTEPG